MSSKYIWSSSNFHRHVDVHSCVIVFIVLRLVVVMVFYCFLFNKYLVHLNTDIIHEFIHSIKCILLCTHKVNNLENLLLFARISIAFRKWRTLSKYLYVRISKYPSIVFQRKTTIMSCVVKTYINRYFSEEKKNPTQIP